MAELPAFKPSGAGAQVDLKNIFESQAIAWGGYKAKLRKQYAEVAKTQWLEGREVYNKLDITNGVYDENSDVYKFLELLGFTPENMQELAEQKSNSDYGIDKMILQYNSTLDNSEESFEKMIDNIVEQIRSFDYMVIGLRGIAYEPGTPEPLPVGPRDFGLWYNTPNNISDTEGIEDPDTGVTEEPTEPDWYFSRWEEGGKNPIGIPIQIPVETRPNVRRSMNNLDIQIVKNGVDVTANYGEKFVQFAALLAIAEPSMSLQQNRRIVRTTMNVNPEWCEVTDEEECLYGVSPKWWTELVTSYTYSFTSINKNVLYSRYPHYVTTCAELGTCKDDATDEQKEEKIPTTNHAAILWDVIAQDILSDLIEATNGLFWLHKHDCKIGLLPDGTFGEVCYKLDVYMTVEGLKNAKPEEFGFYAAQLMEIHYVKKKESWIKRFVGGIIKAFLSLIDALIGIFLKIPVLKQLVEIILMVIGAVFSVDGKSAREILTRIIAAIVMMVVIAFVGPMISAAWSSATAGTALGTASASVSSAAAMVGTNLSVGVTSGMSTLITYSTYAMELYNAGMQGKMVGDMREQALDAANRNYEYRKAQAEMDKVQAAFGGTMGSYADHQSKDMMMYEIMFNPFYYFPQAIPAEETPVSGIK